MPVFNLFFKIMKKHAGSLSIYFFIFLALSITLSQLGKTQQISSFESTAVDICIIDHDQSSLSGALTDYLDTQNTLVSVDDTKSAIQDALYWREIQYCLTIPEGFGERFFSDDPLALSDIKIPGSTTGYLVDQQITSFLQNLRAASSGSLSDDEALTLAEKACAQQTETTLSSGKVSVMDQSPLYFYVKYLPYVFMGLLIMGLGTLLSTLYKPDLNRRLNCSALSLSAFNGQLFGACVVFALGIVAVFCILMALMYHGQFDQYSVPQIFLNMITFMIVSVSLGFFVGMVAKEENAINGLNNIISLGMCFLGGIFVPLNFLSDNIQPISRILPTYWYAQANEIIFGGITDSGNTFPMAIGFQLAFAMALFLIALVISKKKRAVR